LLEHGAVFIAPTLFPIPENCLLSSKSDAFGTKYQLEFENDLSLPYLVLPVSD
jgi:hypothetical protein